MVHSRSSTYRELHGKVYACGESSSGYLATDGETALVEAGTERDVSACP